MSVGAQAECMVEPGLGPRSKWEDSSHSNLRTTRVAMGVSGVAELAWSSLPPAWIHTFQHLQDHILHGGETEKIGRAHV